MTDHTVSEHTFDVAVIGAGASGTLLASQYHKRAVPGARLALIDAAARPGRGVAYETPFLANVLNGPAGNMSAFPDDKLHFVRWIAKRLPYADESTFAPRTVYGDYLEEILAESLQGDSVQLVKARATGLYLQGGFWIVPLHDGRTIAARAIVLAIGNALIPADPLNVSRITPYYRGTPWGADAVRGLADDASVLLIGTGLTTVDVALSLRETGHRGPLYAVSRHGKLYQHHRPYTPKPLDALPSEFLSPRGAFRWVRSAIGTQQAAGGDWRAVIDSLRPHIPQIWHGWTLRQRASFLRHIRNLWDIHRHRMAPEVFTQLTGLLDDGTLTIYAGRLLTAETDGLQARVTIRAAHSEDVISVLADRVINCTGPSRNYTTTDIPPIAGMREQGLLRPDPLKLGIESDAEGRLIAADGSIVHDIYTIGPLRIPSLFESIAMPEIRVQAEKLATVLAAVSPRDDG